jgi:hypothetical protein
MNGMLDEWLFSGGAGGSLTRTLLVLLAVAALAVWTSYAEGIPRWGIALKAPVALSVQLALPGGLAIEVELPRTGPAVLAGKLYVPSWNLAGVRVLPAVGLGGAVAFLPGDIMAAGLYAVVGLESPIPRTRLTLLADLAALLPLPIGAGTLNISPKVGLRLAF